MEQKQAQTRETSAGLNPPTVSEGADPQIQQEQPLVRKLVGLIGGRIVNYVMLDGEVRPMMVVNPWDGSGLINGLLFFDGVNDAKRHVIHLGSEPSGNVPVFAKLLASVEYSEDHQPGTWHWPQKQQVIASGVDPNALATQLMGVNENALQKTARELEIRTIDLVNEKLTAHLQAVNETLDSFKGMVEALAGGKSVRPTEFASLGEATAACGKDEFIHVATDGKITIRKEGEDKANAASGAATPSEVSQGAAAGSEAERAETAS